MAKNKKIYSSKMLVKKNRKNKKKTKILGSLHHRLQYSVYPLAYLLQ